MADEIRSRLTRKWERRVDVIREYGLDTSYFYKVLRNEVHPDPEYNPEQLAPRPKNQPLSTAVLTWDQVTEIRKRITEVWEPAPKIAERHGVTEGVIYGVLSNKTYHDPEYDPATRTPRDWVKNAPRYKGVIYGLYCVCARCPEEGVEYVGQTSQDVSKRLSAHRSLRGADKYTIKADWVRDHGPENIRVKVLEEDPAEGLDLAEAKWIEQLDTLTPNGLNMTPGGYAGAGKPGEDNNSAKLTEVQVRDIIQRIGTDMSVTSRSLGDEYGVTKTLILKIDHGVLWPDVPRPYGTRKLSRNQRVTMTPEEVREARIRFESGEKVAGIAKSMGHSWQMVGNAVKGRTWKDVA